MDGENNPKEVRRRIEQCGDSTARLWMMAAFEMCARPSEVVGLSAPNDTSVARGPKGIDAEALWYEQGKLKERAWVVHVRTAKRRGLVRHVGLPVDYDPWAMELSNYFFQSGEDYVFPFTRQKIWEYVTSNHVFEGLVSTIDHYTVKLPSTSQSEEMTVKKVESHPRPFSIASLRSTRMSELINIYGFDGIDISIHGGWTATTASGMGAGLTRVMDRYYYAQWQRPFPKLLKKMT